MCHLIFLVKCFHFCQINFAMNDLLKAQYEDFIIYPENCSIQIAFVKTFNRFPYCTVSGKVLSYCTGLRTFYRIARV